MKRHLYQRLYFPTLLYTHAHVKKIKLNLDDSQIKINCSKSQKFILDDVKRELDSYFQKVGINYSISISSMEIDVDKTIEELNEAQNRIVQKELEKARQFANEQVEAAPEKVVPIKKSKFTYDDVKMCELRADDQNVSITGRVFKVEETPIRNGKSIFVYYVTDDTDSICVKIFENARFKREDLVKIKEGTYVNFKGNMSFDRFSNDEMFNPNNFHLITKYFK